MNDWIRHDDTRDETPPFSRIFIVCSKGLTEDDLREPFAKFGSIEKLYMPRDRNTGDTRGVAYIKYAKTSSAAAAIQDLHLKVIGNHSKPVKVMVASNKSEDGHNNDVNDDKFRRLFIVVSKNADEPDVRAHFSKFGPLDFIHFQKHKGRDERKGFAYVKYETFLGAALAFEGCDKMYRAVFAKPREELKRSRVNFESADINMMPAPAFSGGYQNDFGFQSRNVVPIMQPRENLNFVANMKPDGYKRICVIIRPQLHQKYIEKLFNIVPELVNFQYTMEMFNSFSKAIITYGTEKAAAYAVEKFDGFEFPSGEILTVKPDINPINNAANNLSNVVNSFKNALGAGGPTPDLLQLADAIAQASSLIKAATTGNLDVQSNQCTPILEKIDYCSVKLPPPQPRADINAPVALRCFVVCKPLPPPKAVMVDAFKRFGNFIDISIIPGKNYGFAKFSSEKSAQNAITTLNDSLICDVKIKVMEANDKQPRDNDNKRMKMDTDNDTE